MSNKFYVCEHCGNLVEAINDTGVPMMCCGQKMTAIEAGSVEASHEKHVPVIEENGRPVTVTVGSVEHPMTEEHSILWIYLETTKGSLRRTLKAGAAPMAVFELTAGEKPLAAYAYCNLHGLWKADVEEEKVCPLQPVDTNTKENYKVCLCNNVSYFDILDAVHKHNKVDSLLGVFEDVKNTTHCSTGCGGCYDKVIKIISDTMMNGER